MDKNESISIYIPDTEAKKFLLFQQYYDTFMIMMESNVFTVYNGSVTLHFDKKGVLKTINRSDVLYSSRHNDV